MFAGIENLQPNPRRGLTALVSFTLQAIAVAAALAIPFLYPNNLPDAFARRRIFVPITENATPIDPSTHAGGSQLSARSQERTIIVVRDNGVHFGPPVPQQSSNAGPDLPPGVSGIYTASENPVGDVAFSSMAPVLAKPPRISVMMQGNLLHRVEPTYPAIAKTVGVQGTVLIKAIISRGGSIEQAQVISGSPLLSPAALEAVRHWKYRPYVLNGAPVEVETQITVNFVLR